MVSRRCVIVTGADTPTGLTTARALRELPVEVIGLLQDPGAAAAQSCCWSRTICIPGEAPEQLAGLVERAKVGEFGNRCVLLFTQDSHVMAAWDCLAVLREHFIVPLPSRENGEIMMDKTRFHHWAMEKAVDVPRSEVVLNSEQLIRIAPGFTFPCILKPLVRTAAWDDSHRSSKFYRLESEEELTDLIQSSDPFSYSPRYILQEWIPGGDCEVFFVLFAIDEDGGILSQYAGRKIWQWPPLAGSTAFCQLTDDRELLDRAGKIVRALGMVGLGSVEFKRDTRNGNFLVTEPTVGRNDYQSGVALVGARNPTAALVSQCLKLEGAEIKSSAHHARCMWMDELSSYRYAKSQGFLRALLRVLVTLLSAWRIRFLYFDFRDLKPFRIHIRRALTRRSTK